MTEIKSNADYTDFCDDYSALIYIINSVVSRVSTLELVKVISVDTTRNTLKVLPIIRNANASGDAIEQSEISGVKYIRWQFGKNALKAVPEAGDIGMAVISHKDISNVESGLVGSYRRFCLSDSIYIGGIFGLNAEPEQFIEFSNSGITVTTPADLTINAQSATINATEINLGGTGGKKIALDGDPVKSGSTTVGTIQASSVTTKSL